jgi:hypothetical protein
MTRNGRIAAAQGRFDFGKAGNGSGNQASEMPGRVYAERSGGAVE